MGAFSNVQDARISKTREFFKSPKGFVETLAQDIAALERKAERAQWHVGFALGKPRGGCGRLPDA
jgi:hypothetical protein